MFRAVSDHKEGDSKGASADRKETVAKEDLISMLKAEFELDIDGHVEEILNLVNNPKASEVQRDEMAEFLVQHPAPPTKTTV